MKIGIISDTHDGYQNVVKATEVFVQQGVSFILHAGDIELADTAEMFAGINSVRFIAVFGNCDMERAELTVAITRFGGQISETYEGAIDGKRIFMAHKPELAASAIESGKFDLVIYGHTHKLKIEKAGRTLVVNPGTSKQWQLSQPHVVIVELNDLSAEDISLI